jgi:4-hydroxy-tetrahydrodipicolinate synthase
MSGIAKEDIRGIFPSVPTPFGDDESVDVERFVKDIDFLLAAGVAGVAVGGSTGEGHSLTLEEVSLLWTAAVQRVGGRAPVIGGIISTHTQEALRRAEAARDAGVDCLMVTPPIYQHPSVAGLRDFFEAISEVGRLPFMIYNVVRHVPITPAILRELVDIPRMIAHKESIGGGLDALSEMIETVGERISVTWAHDPLLYPGLALGATGSISGICAVLPAQCIEMFDAVQRNDLHAASTVHYATQPLMRAFGTSNWASKTKACLALTGRDAGRARAPFVPVTPPERAALREGLIAAGAPIVGD